MSSYEGIILREAILADVPLLREFEQGVIEAERPFDATLKKSGAIYYNLEDLISEDQSSLVVALDQDNIVASGYIQIRASKPYHQHELYGYLGFMFVLPDYRGRGINGRIIDFLTDWARERNLVELRLEVYGQNLPAVKAYERVGFSPVMVEMRRML